MRKLRDNPGESSTRSTQRWPRKTWLIGLIFLAFESLLIGLLGDYFYADIYSTFWMWCLIIVATFGYLFLGYGSGTWRSFAFLPLPILVAFLVGPPGITVGYADGSSVAVHHEPALYVRWVVFSFGFIPAWALGILVRTRKFRISSPAKGM